jgi:hypothetical protein
MIPMYGLLTGQERPECTNKHAFSFVPRWNRENALAQCCLSA